MSGGGSRLDRHAGTNDHSELAAKVKIDYKMWSPSTRKKVRRNGTGLSQSFNSEINSSMMPYNDIAMAREARESIALQKNQVAQGKFKLFKRKLSKSKKTKNHAQQQVLLDPADLEFEIEEIKEEPSNKEARKKSKRKKATNESSLRSELSEAFDSRASDPIHVNNLRFG